MGLSTGFGLQILGTTGVFFCSPSRLLAACKPKTGNDHGKLPFSWGTFSLHFYQPFCQKPFPKGIQKQGSFTCHSADSWSHFICSQVNVFTDPFFETNPTTDTGKALTGLQLVKTMSKRATGPFGASALLKEFAKTCPGSQLHGSTVVFLEKLHLCIPPKCCNPHENCSEVPRVLLPHTSRMPYSICLPTTIGSFSLGRV